MDVLPDFVGQAPVIQGMIAAMKRVARSMAGVLVIGETGTGKGIVARAIHDLSARAAGPFVVVGCSTMVLHGLEAGWRRVEDADGGTLFLDEIASIAAELQFALLGLLQHRESLDASRGSQPLDFRVIASSSVDLEGEVEDGRFRADLFHRLNCFPIRVPPLRERREDIPHLVEAIRERFGHVNQVVPPEVPPHVMRDLMRYPWPGNVRELENVIERSMLVHVGQHSIELTLAELQASSAGTPPDDERWSLANVEREHVLKVLGSVKGHQGKQARILGISRRTLYRKLRDWSGDDAPPAL